MLREAAEKEYTAACKEAACKHATACKEAEKERTATYKAAEKEYKDSGDIGFGARLPYSTADIANQKRYTESTDAGSLRTYRRQPLHR